MPEQLDLESLLGEQSQPFDWRKYLTAVRENWWVVLLVFAAVTGTAVVYVMRATPIYQSRATLMIEQRQANVVKVESVEQVNMMAIDMMQTIVQSIQSRTVYERVVDSLDLVEDKTFLPPLPDGQRWSKPAAVGYLAGSVRASLRELTRLVDVSAEHPDPEKARVLADAVAKEFIRMGMEQRAASTRMAYQFLSEEAARLREKVRRSEQAMQEYRVKHEATSLEESQNLVLVQLKDANSQLLAARAERLRLETDLQKVKEIGDNVQELLKLQSVAAMPNVGELARAIAQREADFVLLKQRYRQSHPAYIASETDLANLRGRLDEAVKHGTSLLGSVYERAKVTEARLDEAVAESEKLATELSQKAIEYNVLKRDYETDLSLFQAVLARMKETDLTQGLGESPVKLVEPAVAPGLPVRPKVAKTVQTAAAGGLALGFAMAVGLAMLGAGLKNIDETERALKLPVLSAIPERDSKKLDAHEVLTDQRSLVSEAFRSFRASVNLLGPQPEKKKLMITSALPGEGKTYVSCSVAVTMAQSGQRTLVIDADLRKPNVSKTLLGRTAKPGLTDVLAGQASLDQAIVAGPHPNLWVLPAGSNAPNPAELMSQEAFGAVVAEAAGRFDRLVIDTAPVLVVSDTRTIARCGDLLCLVLQARKTPRGAAERAIKLLADIGRRPAGIVLNRFAPTDAGYSHYYYYGHYGRRPAADGRARGDGSGDNPVG